MLPHVIHYPKDTIDDNPLFITDENDIAKLNDKNWSSITMNEQLCLGFQYELIVNYYPRIQFIHVQDNIYHGISNVTISNLPELKLLVVEDWSFSYAITVTLSSIF